MSALQSLTPGSGSVGRSTAVGAFLVLAVSMTAGCSHNPLQPDNKVPTATASATPMSGSPPLSVTFAGTGADPDGVWVAYAWDFGDGISAKVKDVTHTYVSAGTYTATLTVIDADLAEGKATVKITVTGGGNQRPTASVSASPMSGTAPLQVGFSGSGSDPDGTIASYAWAFGDGGTSTQQVTTHTYQSAGTYTATLTVTDNGGATGTATVQIAVSGPANQPPSASASASPTSGPAPLAVAFTGSGTDPDGTIASYAWAFGDGGTSTLQNPSHTYQSGGNYTATLTVTDNGGAKGSATVAITVQQGNHAPTANAGADQTNKDPGTTINLNGSASLDVDGNMLSYQWTQTAGPAVTLSGATTATPSFVSAARTTATYTFTLTVTDNGSPPMNAQDSVNVSTRVTYVNTIRTLYSDRGVQANGKKLGCVGCHAPGLSRPQSPLTTYAEVYNWRTKSRSLLISGGSMRQYLATGEPQVVIDWIDAGAPETN